MAEVLTIEELRTRIDVIDEQLVRLLNLRVAWAVEVGGLERVWWPQDERSWYSRLGAGAVWDQSEGSDG